MKLAGVNLNNWFTDVWGLDRKCLINYNFTCKHFWRSIDHVFADFLQPFFFTFCKGISFYTTRFVQASVGWVRHIQLEHVSTLLAMKRNHFLHNFESRENVFVVIPPQEVFASLHFLFFPYILRVRIVFMSSRRCSEEFQFNPSRFFWHSAFDKFFLVLVFFLKRVSIS